MQEKWTSITTDKASNGSRASDQPDLGDKRKLPARQTVRVTSLQQKSSQHPMSGEMQGPNSKRARMGVASAATRAAAGMTAPGLSATAAFALALADIGPLMTEIIKAQAESNLQLQQSVQTNMFGNIRATLTTLAAMGSSKESKLLDSKLRTLQACSGHGDSLSFVLFNFYAKLDKNGMTSNNCGTGLCPLVSQCPAEQTQSTSISPPRTLLQQKP